jgi:hypothetical protein
MSTFKEDPAAYMRAYRARKRGEPVIDKALPRGTLTKANPAELACVAAKLDAIGHPNAVITKTAGRLDVVTRQAFEARQQAPVHPLAVARLPSLVKDTVRPQTAAPSRALTVAGPTPLQGEVISPPRSMIADGGTPPRRYAKDASVAEATALIRAYAAEQARINAETARRLDTLERDKAERDRRVAALEDRQARVVGFVQGIAGVFSLVARG